MASFEVSRYNNERECAVSFHDTDHSRIEFSWLKGAMMLVIARYENGSDVAGEQVLLTLAEVSELLKLLLLPEMQRLLGLAA